MSTFKIEEAEESRNLSLIDDEVQIKPFNTLTSSILTNILISDNQSQKIVPKLNLNKLK
jgi:hypothetical protein